MNGPNNSIGWCDYTWNPITGCLNNCFYCYVRKIYKRFKKDFAPQIHYNRLREPFKLKKPSKIFVCSVSDLCGKGVKPMWREEVYLTMRSTPKHVYQVLTKQPQNIKDWGRIPENVWLGVTITGDRDKWKGGYLRRYKGVRFVSFEPLLAVPNVTFVDHNWVIVGAMTGPGSKKYAPRKEWIQGIINQARAWSIPIFLKGNLKWPEKIQEFPK